MNALFHHNMQQQIAANEAARIAAQQAMVVPDLPKDCLAYPYLHFIFSQGKATSQQLQALRPDDSERFAVYQALSIYIRKGLVSYTKLNRYGGIYQPAEGKTAADVGIDLDDDQ
jgi:hypothetical protein